MRFTLRQARLNQKLTQRQLGELVGLTKQAISAIERGVNDARARTWRKLATALKISQEYLQRQKDQP